MAQLLYYASPSRHHRRKSVPRDLARFSRGAYAFVGNYFSVRMGGDGRSAKAGFFDPRYRGGDDGRPEIPTGRGNASKPQRRLYPLMDPIRSWKPRLLVAIT